MVGCKKHPGWPEGCLLILLRGCGINMAQKGLKQKFHKSYVARCFLLIFLVEYPCGKNETRHAGSATNPISKLLVVSCKLPKLQHMLKYIELPSISIQYNIQLLQDSHPPNPPCAIRRRAKKSQILPLLFQRQLYKTV